MRGEEGDGEAKFLFRPSCSLKWGGERVARLRRKWGLGFSKWRPPSLVCVRMRGGGKLMKRGFGPGG